MFKEGPTPKSNVQESSVDRIPSRDHVLAEISKYCENPHAKVNREMSDDKGVYFLEVQSKDASGDMILYEYKRAGMFPNQNHGAVTSINAVYFKGEMPLSGESLANYNPEAGKWEPPA